MEELIGIVVNLAIVALALWFLIEMISNTCF